MWCFLSVQNTNANVLTSELQIPVHQNLLYMEAKPLLNTDKDNLYKLHLDFKPS